MSDSLYLLIEWVDGNPIVNGATYYETRGECLNAYNRLSSIYKIYPNYKAEFTICVINRG